MRTKDIVLSINVVEPALVQAVKKLGSELGVDLKGIMLVDASYAKKQNRPKDTTGLFEEIVCDFENPDELQSAVKPYLNRMLLVVVRYESAIQAFRKAIPFLPYVNTPTETSLLWATDKSQMRARLGNYDQRLVPQNLYFQEEDMPRLGEMLSDFSYPVIVKPSALAGSLLVSRCDDEEQVKNALEVSFKLSKEVHDRVGHENMPGFMIEEMMQGPMYSTDAYILPNGDVYCLPLVRVVTGHEMGLPGFFSYSLTLPTGLPENEVAEAFRVSTDGIKALNLRALTAHVELFRTPEGWKIIEIGGRIGGYRQDMYREAYGIDHFYNDLRIRIGKEPVMPSAPIKYTIAFEIYADEEGVISSIEGLERAREVPGVLFVKTHAKPGDRVLFADKGGQPVMNGLLSNTDKEQAKHDVEEIRELIKINIENGARAATEERVAVAA